MIRTQLHWMKIACTDIYVLELNVKNPRPLCLYVPGINYISDRETQMRDFYLSPWAGWRGRHWQRRRGKWRAVWKFQGVCWSLWWASVSLLRCPTRWQLHQGSVPAHSLRKDYCLTGLGGLGTGAVWDKKMYIRDFWTLIFSLGQHNPSYIKRTIRAILKYYFNETSLHSSSVTALSWSGSKAKIQENWAWGENSPWMAFIHTFPNSFTPSHVTIFHKSSYMYVLRRKKLRNQKEAHDLTLSWH